MRVPVSLRIWVQALVDPVGKAYALAGDPFLELHPIHENVMVIFPLLP